MLPCRLSSSQKAIPGLVFAVMGWAPTVGCRPSRADAEPSIEFSKVPPADFGSSEKVETVQGRVRGARPGQRIVLFAMSGQWWVQPYANQPFTEIQRDSTWKSVTHPGAAFAALLVDPQYRPPLTVNALPEKGAHVLAVAEVRGASPNPSSKTIAFSGYQWEVRQTPNQPGGSRNLYDARNVWTDQHGFLHLRIRKQEDHWVSGEIKLSRSLGYGSYRFEVQDLSHLEPAAVFAMFTWDDLGPTREMDIEISRWGEPEDKNGQFVVQPFVIPANTVRFQAPAGTLTYRMGWQPGRVSFETIRGAAAGPATVSQHVFTSGVPSPGSERVHLNLYVYDNKRYPLQHETEVIVERFEFLP